MKILLIAAVTTAVVVGPRSADAFTCSRVGVDSGPSLVWPTRSIGWYADTEVFGLFGDPATVEAEVLASFAAWENVDCSDFALPFRGAMPALSAEYIEDASNLNVVDVVRAGWEYDTGAIAVTTSAYDTRTGEVVDADIEFNAQVFEFTLADSSCAASAGTMDLRNTLTHEVGHLIGLEHPPNAARYQETTMFASAPPCETRKRSLAQDDIDGICAIYPIGQPTAQCFPPDGPSLVVVNSDDGFGGCQHTGGPGSPILLLVPFLWLLIRSR